MLWDLYPLGILDQEFEGIISLRKVVNYLPFYRANVSDYLHVEAECSWYNPHNFDGGSYTKPLESRKDPHTLSSLVQYKNTLRRDHTSGVCYTKITFSTDREVMWTLLPDHGLSSQGLEYCNGKYSYLRNSQLKFISINFNIYHYSKFSNWPHFYPVPAGTPRSSRLDLQRTNDKTPATWRKHEENHNCEVEMPESLQVVDRWYGAQYRDIFAKSRV